MQVETMAMAAAAAASLALLSSAPATLPTGRNAGFAKERLAQQQPLRLKEQKACRRIVLCAASGGKRRSRQQNLKEKKLPDEDKKDSADEQSNEEVGVDKGVSGAKKEESGYSTAKKRIEEELERQKNVEEEAASAKREIETVLAKQQELEGKQRLLERKRKEQALARQRELEARQRQPSGSRKQKRTVGVPVDLEARTVKEPEETRRLDDEKEETAKAPADFVKELEETQKVYHPKAADNRTEERLDSQKFEERDQQNEKAAEEKLDIDEVRIPAEMNRGVENGSRKLREDEEAKRRIEAQAQRLKEEAEAETERLRREEELKRKMEIEAALARQRQLELEAAKEREKAETRKREIRRLADLSAPLGKKIFYYPATVQAGTEVEIFINRSITTLKNEENIQIMGAYNKWAWNSFNIKLDKSELPGDWWSCKVEVPKEAHVMNFVFMNGNDLYENNDTKDFFIPVFGGMDEEQFQRFWVQEKRNEAERLARDQEEKERAAEEARKLAENKAAEEADRAEAKKKVAEQKEKNRKVLQKAVRNIDGLWHFEPPEFCGGQVVRLVYNPSRRPLEAVPEIWVHGGYNNWQEAVSISKKLTQAATSIGAETWWSTEIFVPEEAFVLNWVFADGPPGRATVYDNNDYQDFHGLVPMPIPEDEYWKRVEEKIYARLREERRKREDALRQKEEYKARMKERMRQKTRESFMQSQARIIFTEPAEIKAGETVSLLYNPANTVLNGKPEVWVRYSFNRWAQKISLEKMSPTGSSSHLKTDVHVPYDAYVMDAVFSDKGDDRAEVYDNKGGLDYHIPVVEGISREPPLSIVHISVEMAPIAKVGGLGDVVTSLSRAIQEMGHKAEVILPKFDCLRYDQIHELKEVEAFHWGGTKIRVWNGKVEGLTVHFLEPENGLFWAGCIYGRRDDAHRFGFFCQAALEFLLRSGQHPDIIHCHDWSTAPVAWLFQESYKHYGLSNTRVVFTIHNLEFGIGHIGKAMATANMATTVSQTYAKEVSGNPAISPHLFKFHGIRNGIDLDIWEPFDDPYIPVSYTAEQVSEGKKAAKRELQHRLGLEQVDRPLVGIITRLTAQKGIHLIKHAIWRTLDRGGQVVLLGSAPDPRVQNDFVNLSNQLQSSHNSSARLCLTYDEPLSHLIYAASDYILVPSMFEPCGLTQLIAMRYGAIPVVRRTGGLNDTVFDVEHDRHRAEAQGLEPNGFCFDGTDAAGVDYALNRALNAWYESRDWFNGLCAKVMEQDWSWNRPALDYVELYYGAKK